MGGADQHVRAMMLLMVKDRGYNGEDCSYRMISPYWTEERIFTEDRFLLFKLALCMGYG